MEATSTLHGRAVLLTGGGTGIGRATARQFAAAPGHPDVHRDLDDFLTHTWAVELAPQGIRVVPVAPV